MYFVNTIEELQDTYAISCKEFEAVGNYQNLINPFPPIILIVQDKSSALLNPHNLYQIPIPILVGLTNNVADSSS